MKHFNNKSLPEAVNPVSKVKEWFDTDIKCNHCGGDCRRSEVMEQPNGSKAYLLNCTNRFHLNGEYGFYVEV